MKDAFDIVYSHTTFTRKTNESESRMEITLIDQPIIENTSVALVWTVFHIL